MTKKDKRTTAKIKNNPH